VVNVFALCIWFGLHGTFFSPGTFKAIAGFPNVESRLQVTGSNQDVVVIGGGAAGLFCAIQAGKRGRRVLVLERSDRIGKKIAISGGGRCNFTNIHTRPDNFVSANPHFCKSALARYTPADFIALVEQHGINYHEKKSGQLFCDQSSQQIIDMLLHECADAGVEVLCGCQVRGVSRENVFTIETNQGRFASTSLVIATGGLSIAPLGATDFGYSIARQFGLEIEPPRPALVPFTLSSAVQRQLSSLSGISLPALVNCGEVEFRENILITHRGLSGPAILQISLYWEVGAPISINLLPDEEILEILKAKQSSDIELANLLAQHLPRRFAQAWCNLYAPSRPLKQFNNSELSDLALKIQRFQITPAGTEGFKKAEVTAGGVATAELSSQTMEAKRVPGLYFIGEVVDVTGQLGGSNFQWAGASGHAAGQVA
jgi:predicted Rossmann fold flavoprotein